MDLDLETIPNDAETARQIDAALADGATTIRNILDKIPGARRLILIAAFRALGARKWYFEKGRTEKVFEPDYRTQLDAVKLLVAYQDGLPVQTTLSVNVGDKAGADLDLEQAVQRSPALKERLQKLVGPVVETDQKRVRK